MKILPHFIALFLLVLSGPVFVSKVYATIYLNEISPASDPEWVELYNDSSQAVSLEGWEVADAQTGSYHFGVTITQTIQTATISAYGYLVVSGPQGTSTPDLSNSGETISLYDETGSIKDTMAYDVVSDSSKAYCRVPDGSSTYLVKLSSQNISNNEPTPTPTPTATPVPTPTLTPTPTLSPTPKPTSTPTPTPTSTSKPKLSPIVTPSPTPSPSVANESLSPSILGESTEVSPTSAPSPTATSSKSPVGKAPILPIVAVVLGSLLLLSAVFFLLTKYLKVSSDGKITEHE